MFLNPLAGIVFLLVELINIVTSVIIISHAIIIITDGRSIYYSANFDYSIEYRVRFMIN